MPLYTYRCNNCGHQFDERQSFDDASLKKCPECGKLELRKVYLPVGILFKGPGFYATDHRSASGANGQHSKKEEKSESASEQTAKEKTSTGKSETTD